MLTQLSAAESTTEVALAILTQGDRWLLQLRDDFDWILYPGQWGLFGGHLEPSETPDQGLRRELAEEIGYTPSTVSFLWTETEATVTRHLFHVPLHCPIASLQLMEGQDLDLVTWDAIATGQVASPKLRQKRSIGAPHQQILQRFHADYRHLMNCG